MPRIPTLDNQTRGLSPLQPARPQANVSTGLQSIGAALGDANQTIQRVRQEEQLKADRAAFMEADRTLGENENAILNDPTSGALNYRGRDAFDITSKALEEFDAAGSKSQEALSTDRQRLAFGESLQQRRQALERTLQRHESTERESYYANEREAYKAAAQNSALTNYRDPARIEQEIEKARAAIDQTPGLSAEQRAGELGQRRSAIYGGVIDRYLANDDIAPAEKYYASVRDRVDGETATNIERALRIAKDRAEAKRDSGTALARAELQDEVRDIESAFRLRLPVASIPGEGRFVALYGERGKKMHAQVRLMADASQESARLTQMPTAEVMRVAAGYAPKAVEGAAMRAEVAGILQQQAAIDVKERAEDPAGYLVRHSPSVQATWQDFSNGGDVKRYLTAVRAEQERLQLPPGDLLPDAYADEVATRISTSDAEGMTALIQTEAERWGQAWPEVYGQLAPKMTDIAAVIGSGIPDYAADILASTSGLKTSELEAGLPTDIKRKDVDDSVRSQFEQFNQSFPIDASRTVGAFNDSAARLAMGYMQKGSSLADATKKAFTDLVGNYEINEFRSVPYRVPKTESAAIIEDGAEDIMRNFSAPSGSIEQDRVTTWDGYPAIRNEDGSFSTRLTATVTTSDLNAGKPTNIPTIWRGQKLSEREAIAEAVKSGETFPTFETIDEAVGAAKELSESIGQRSYVAHEELMTQYNEYIRDHGYWMTTPNESGLRLYVDGGPVVKGDGPIEYTWQQLTERAMTYRTKREELARKQRAEAAERSLQPGLR